MTLEEIELVQESWQKVVPMQDAAAKLFYFKLFELDPSCSLCSKTTSANKGAR